MLLSPYATRRSEAPKESILITRLQVAEPELQGSGPQSRGLLSTEKGPGVWHVHPRNLPGALGTPWRRSAFSARLGVKSGRKHQ